MKLAGCDWISQRHSLLLIGPAGVGKSWLACALGNKACREDFSVAYHRLPRLFATLALSRGDGRYPKVLKALARTDLLILDDWGPEKLNDEQRRDLLEIVEDRYERRSTIVTSQVPVDHWYDMIGNPTIADAILDRLVHNAYSNFPARACESSVKHHPPLDRATITSHSKQRPRGTPTVRLQIGTVSGTRSEYLSGFRLE